MSQTVNTHVTALNANGEMVTLKPGDTIPDGVNVTNPHVIGEPSDEQTVVPGPSQRVPYDPDSPEATSKASPSLEGDGLDRKSHAELDVVAEDERVSFADLGDTPTRQEKITAIRAKRTADAESVEA